MHLFKLHLLVVNAAINNNTIDEINFKVSTFDTKDAIFF